MIQNSPFKYKNKEMEMVYAFPSFFFFFFFFTSLLTTSREIKHTVSQVFFFSFFVFPVSLPLAPVLHTLRYNARHLHCFHSHSTCLLTQLAHSTCLPRSLSVFHFVSWLTWKSNELVSSTSSIGHFYRQVFLFDQFSLSAPLHCRCFSFHLYVSLVTCNCIH